MRHSLLLSAAILLTLAGVSHAEDKKTSFDNKDALTGWTTSGDVSIDTTKNHDATVPGGALKIAPGGKASWKLSDTNSAGTISLWVFDDGSAPVDPKAAAAGPTWGIVGADGKALVVGPLYARYLAGDKSYTAGDYDTTVRTDAPQRKVQFLGVTRSAGWHEWTFTMDKDKGLSISVDGKDVNAARQRFDWNKTDLAGIASLALVGDTTNDPKQTLWVDDVSVSLTGPMIAKPAGAANEAAAVPATDPTPDHPVQLLAAVSGKHPRLLFTEADIPKLKASAEGAGKPFMEQLEAYLPVSRAPENETKASDDTDAQRMGFWRAPTVAVHYAMYKDKKSFDAGKGLLEWMIKQAHWEESTETDSGMGAANIATGAAILYDCLYNELDPTFREQCRQKLLLQARRQYYLGHLNRNHAVAYWQGDPLNNHRWHRDSGLTLCALAVAGDGPGDAFILAKDKEELDFVTKWLPGDGTSHESPSYWVFGSPQLTLAVDAADRCLGTQYLDLPYFKNAPMFRMQTLCPGLKSVFGYGDFGGTGNINSFEFLYTGHDHLADLQDGLLKFYKATAQPGPKGGEVNHAFEFGVYSLLWFNPDVTGGSIDNLPQNYYFDDLGLAFARDGWMENNVAMMFKCAPLGGYSLNAYRRTKDMGGVNVAHDDPDVNQFQIYTGGAVVARDDGYSTDKLSSAHNTILVNGHGQRGEGGQWSQPLQDFDMSRLGVMTTWKVTPDVTVAEGEGAGAYPALDRYRRTALWVKGSYILILDDIRGDKPNEITWLVQADGLTAADASKNQYTLHSGKASCDFMLAADSPLTGDIAISSAQNHGESMNLKQLQEKATAKTVRIAAVFDPWKKGDIQVTLTPVDADHATVTVTGKDFTDTWTWTAAPERSYTPSTIKGERKGGFTVDIGPADKAEIPLADIPPVTAPDDSAVAVPKKKPAVGPARGKKGKKAAKSAQ